MDQYSNKEIIIDGEDFCYFEDIENNIIGITPISNPQTVPNNAIAFVYVHQSEEENRFLRTYRIGKRIEKDVFDCRLRDEALKYEDHLIMIWNHHSDYCELSVNGKGYFYAINDDDVVVDSKEQLDDAFAQAIATKGAYIPAKTKTK